MPPCPHPIVLAERGHAPALWSWRSDPLARRHNPFDPGLRVEDEGDRLAAAGQDPVAGWRELHRWVLLGPGGEPWASAGLKPNPRMGLVELSYMCAPAARGRGLAPWVAAHALDRAFAAGARKAFAMVAAGNEGSQRVMEKLGFVLEGRLRAHYVIEGRPTDELSYGLLAQEWAQGGGGR